MGSEGSKLSRRDIIAASGIAAAASLYARRTAANEAANVERGHLDRAYDVDVDPDVLVDMIADWGRLDKYLPSSLEERVRIEIRPGSREGVFPCQRRSYVQFPARPGAAPVEVHFDETLISVDTAARTLIYRVDSLGPDASRNFIAFVEIDDLGDGRSRLGFHARFDLPRGGPIDAYTARLAAEYAMLAKGFAENAATFVRERRAAFVPYRDQLAPFARR